MKRIVGAAAFALVAAATTVAVAEELSVLSYNVMCFMQAYRRKFVFS